ncbi:Hypothetical predicted protein [Xyrichtys novacula]|uniref:Uncharacterized protein n=1 Tax=Xyrichtys novacula TaxID=13765 RepID=A0AAV1GE61_XYRNO|nr:Hypothetical predicted protein [Xyrichtys novacula]
MRFSYRQTEAFNLHHFWFSELVTVHFKIFFSFVDSMLEFKTLIWVSILLEKDQGPLLDDCLHETNCLPLPNFQVSTSGVMRASANIKPQQVPSDALQLCAGESKEARAGCGEMKAAKKKQQTKNSLQKQKKTHSFRQLFSSVEGKGQTDQHLPLKTGNLSSLYANFTENILIRHNDLIHVAMTTTGKLRRHTHTWRQTGEDVGCEM